MDHWTKLGLFLGASLIAFIEIGMLLLDELKRLLLPRKCKKKVEKFDATLNLPEITDKSEQNKPDSEEQLVKETEAWLNGCIVFIDKQGFKYKLFYYIMWLNLY